MIDNERKQMFLRTIENNNVWQMTNTVFGQVQQLEEQKGKDASEFTEEDIEDFIKQCSYLAIFSIITKITRLRAYTKWCVEQHLVDVNAYDDFTYQRIASLHNDKEDDFDRDTFYDMVASLPNKADAFILIAVFEGIKGLNFSEIINLKLSDFDMVNKTVKLPDKTIHVSDTLLQYAVQANKELYRTAYSDPDCVTKLTRTDYIVKYKTLIEGDRRKATTIKMRIRDALNELGLNDMTLLDVYKNGIRYYISVQAKKENLTVNEYIQKNLATLQKRFDIRQSLSKFKMNYGTP